MLWWWVETHLYWKIHGFLQSNDQDADPSSLQTSSTYGLTTQHVKRQPVTTLAIHGI